MLLKLKTSAKAQAFPQSPCSARFNIVTELKGLSNDIKKITELTVPTARTKLYVKAELIPVFEIGIKIEHKRFNLFAPKDFAASSRFGFIWEKLDEMILYENGKKEIVIAIMINIFELVKWILFAAIKMESPNREPGMQEGIWINIS